MTFFPLVMLIALMLLIGAWNDVAFFRHCSPTTRKHPMTLTANPTAQEEKP